MNLRNQLLSEGYCIIPNILGSAFISKLRDSTNLLIDAMTENEQTDHRSTGSLIPSIRCEACGELIGHADLHQAIEALGFSDWRYSGGYIISKPPHSPPLFWHFDWAGWDHSFSYCSTPTQLFIMVYLVDTSSHNGCLRVIPRSHIEDHPLHNLMGQAHTDEIRRASNLSAIEFQSHPDEVNVAVKAGDLVIGDSRLIHSAHANNSNVRRTVITLWFHPNYNSLPESIQGYIARLFQDAPDEVSSWDSKIRQRFYNLRPVYAGTEMALPFNRNRLSRKASCAKKRVGDI